ncbi:hypothetical protein C0J52_15425 [Blattella germanica]|nr:hypothetical protein C0J52_15425 [Blattella germanica]
MIGSSGRFLLADADILIERRHETFLNYFLRFYRVELQKRLPWLNIEESQPQSDTSSTITSNTNTNTNTTGTPD